MKRERQKDRKRDTQKGRKIENERKKERETDKWREKERNFNLRPPTSDLRFTEGEMQLTYQGRR